MSFLVRSLVGLALVASATAPLTAQSPFPPDSESRSPPTCAGASQSATARP